MQFPRQRTEAWNEQKKPDAFKFGNLYVARPEALYRKEGFLSGPAFGLQIDWFDAIDIDNKDDLDIANALCNAGYWQENGK